MSDQLRQRMQEWEASPPPGAWTAIAMALAEVNAENQLAAKMEAVEIIPPADARASVLQALHPEETEDTHTHIIPVQPLYPYLFRYGAAAIVIGLAAWVLMGNPFWQKNPRSEAAEAAKVPHASTNKETVPIQSPDLTTAITGSRTTTPDENLQTEELAGASREITGEISNHLPVREPAPSQVTDKPVSLKDSPLAVKSPAVYTPLREQPDLPLPPRNQRYITVMNLNGDPVRLSAKFAPVYYSLFNSADKDLDAATTMLKKMQLQLNRRPFIPDPNNHFDLIQFVDLLQREQ